MMETKKEGFFARLKERLKKTNRSLAESLVALTTGRLRIDSELLEEIENTLIAADVGIATTTRLIASLEGAVKSKEVTKPEEVRDYLRKEIEKLLGQGNNGTEAKVPPNAPFVILTIGVNGAGKTTTIGKLAWRYKSEGKNVLLAAGDTFRAGAIDQLDEWSRRVGCDIVKHQPNSDPSAVAFDAMKAAIARRADVVIIDTAGRLHTRTNLMDELAKVRRIIGRELEGAPHETYLVLDGTTGQNALNQAKEFHSKIEITGLILTKLDGTSKGGAVIGIVNEINIPVRYIGIGEKIDDLQPFDPKWFAEAVI